MNAGQLKNDSFLVRKPHKRL